MAWLAIDAGTSVIKTVLFGDTGAELAVARESISVTRPLPGHAEQDMTAVWQTVLTTIEAVLALDRIDRSAIQGIVCTAQGDGVWLVDRDGSPTGPAILWNDGRAASLVEQWHDQGILDAAFRLSGSVAYPGLPCAIWRWLAEHDEHNEPDEHDKNDQKQTRLARSRWSLTASGWIYRNLTGSIYADLTDASNPFLDIAARTYSPKLFNLFGVETLAHLLPPVSETLPDPLLDELATRLCLPAGTPVIMAPYDIAATATGSGSVHAGEGCLILGTTICAEVLVHEIALDGTPAGTTLALRPAADGQPLFLRAMPTLTGCEALDWIASTLGIDTLDELSRIAAAASPGAGNLVFLPYLSPAGERSPFIAPSARGSLLGLSLEHTRADIARAVFEGLSFVIRDCLAATTSTQPHRLAVSGGGSRSDLWCQIIADVCQCAVIRPQASETGARGAFFYALVATGKAASLAEAADRCPVASQTFSPETHTSSLYDTLFHRFLQLRKHISPTWELMRPAPASITPIENS